MLTAGIFLCVTVAALVTLQFSANAARRDRGLVRRRLAQEFAAANGPTAGNLYKDLGSLDGEAWSDPQQPTAKQSAAPPAASRWQRFGQFVKQSGLPVTREQLAGGTAAVAVLLGGAGGWAAGGFGAMLGAATGAGVPLMVVNAAGRRRRERLIVQLATGFDQMGRVLRAGQSVAEALRSVVETSGEPLAGEFTGCLHQIEMGIRPEEAFRELGQDASVLELRLFVLAMSIHRQTGGNLAEVLDRLGGMTRARVRLRQKINALTAEGRLQSITLVVMPPLTFAVMYLLNRQYAEQLLEHTKLLFATAGLMGVGVLWTRKIINFEG